MSEPHSSPASADRNLLFGILALQMDFIGRDALIAAMNVWVLQKNKPLGEILLDQGALDPRTHTLLTAMVQRHLELHANDPQQSLAAVSFLGPTKQDLLDIADADLHDSLAHVPGLSKSTADLDATADPSVGTPTSAGMRFRILRPHARGGLGQVSVAHDEELHREVALKEIKPSHAGDAQSRARFL